MQAPALFEKFHRFLQIAEPLPDAPSLVEAAHAHARLSYRLAPADALACWPREAKPVAAANLKLDDCCFLSRLNPAEPSFLLLQSEDDESCSWELIEFSTQHREGAPPSRKIERPAQRAIDPGESFAPARSAPAPEAELRFSAEAYNERRGWPVELIAIAMIAMAVLWALASYRSVFDSKTFVVLLAGSIALLSLLGGSAWYNRRTLKL
jgi:hypothetical protein